jgi:PEP-CTERM motif
MPIRSFVASLSIVLAGMLGFTPASAAPATDLGVLNAAGSSFSQSFWRVFNHGASFGEFSDHYTFTLSQPASVSGATTTFDWGSLGLTLNAVSLSGGSLGGTTQIDPSPNSLSFNTLGAGMYTLSVSGELKKSPGFLGYAYYTGSVKSIASAAPEPESLALLAVGLAGVGFMVKRKRR